MKGIRRSIGVVLVGIAIFVGFSGTAHAAQQSTGEAENTLTADINQERTSRGLGALSVASDLVAYARQHIAYRTFDADATEVLRLAFRPARIMAAGSPLAERADLKAAGFTIKPLAGGDFVVRIRHMDSREVRVE